MILVYVQPYDPKKSLLDLKRKAQREGLYPKVKMSRFHESNPEKKIRKEQESSRRRRKTHRANQDY